jgi:hypothetical protein
VFELGNGEIKRRNLEVEDKVLNRLKRGEVKLEDSTGVRVQTVPFNDVLHLVRVAHGADDKRVATLEKCLDRCKAKSGCGAGDDDEALTQALEGEPEDGRERTACHGLQAAQASHRSGARMRHVHACALGGGSSSE